MEEILHYVWKFRLYQKNLRTTDNLPIEVIDVGIPNTNEGPDFFNAKIKIDDKVWAGNIEIHTSSDDWNKHNHQTNKAYNSVILHVVANNNCRVVNQQGQLIPQCEITYPKHIEDNYAFLIHSSANTPCANYIAQLSPILINSWMNSLLLERLERKANHIESLLTRFTNSWDDVFYILLCRTFGFGLNSDSFERLALSLPLKFIKKHKDNFVQIEALLFGQAGMLDCCDKGDDYLALLQKEYAFLKHKYELQPLESFVFKTLRNRPSSFPEIRIAQLAAIVNNIEGLFSKIANCEDLGRLKLLFHINASEYWQNHYKFGKVSEKKSKYLGDSSLDIILINTVIPLLFAYQKSVGNEDGCEKAISFLEQIKPEKNTITKQFSKCQLPCNNSADSQALIQLKKEYCELRKCLYCRIGHKIMTNK